MKKLIVLAFSLILITLLASTAFADIDLSAMTVNELNELIANAQNEIINKGGDIKISKGTYIGNKDLAAGSYEVSLSEPMDSVIYMFYDSNNKYTGGEHIYADSWVRFSINENESIYFSHNIILRKAAKIGF